jgi:hypothetical protein
MDLHEPVHHIMPNTADKAMLAGSDLVTIVYLETATLYGRY